MKRILSVVGARPNFMKLAPLCKALREYETDLQNLVCHTGQHYDHTMSRVFFDELEIPEPDFFLNAGSGSHAIQTAAVMCGFEKVVDEVRPDIIVVVGDVNSTLACSLVAAKLCVPIAHVEAGLRSFDRTMPEEINRVLTDTLAEHLFVTEKSGLENLKNEGMPDERVHFVGNVMIDSLLQSLHKIDRSEIHKRLGIKRLKYILATVHRPSNVDSIEALSRLARLLKMLAQQRQVVFPIHPRTKANINLFGLQNEIPSNVLMIDPVGYVDFLALVKGAEIILTDSGGVQEESTYLGVQCLTLRTSTERPVTIELGTNHLIGENVDQAERIAFGLLKGIGVKRGVVPPMWDGNTARRIAAILHAKVSSH